MRIRFENSVNRTDIYGEFVKVPLLIIDTKNILSIEKNRFTLINDEEYYASDRVIKALSDAFTINHECYTID